MTKSRWKKLIVEQMAALGVQNMPSYASVVETLAGILEERDRVYDTYRKSGEGAVREYTNKAGATNLTKNPLLVLWDELNKTALAYWRELGLTPSSYKKMTGDGPRKEKPGGIAEALGSLEV